MIPTMTRAMGAVALSATFLAGCYVYRPGEPSEVRPDSRVRLTVSARQAAELEEALRDTRRTFTATYLGENDGHLLFSVPLLNPTPGTSRQPVHNRVAVPHGDVTALELRELSKWRTATAIAGGVLAVGYAAWEAFGGHGNPRPEDKPPDVDNTLIPLFSIPIGW